MQLKAYLIATKETPAAFARRIGVHRAHISRYLKGRIPEMPIQSKIAAGTDWQVSGDDWLEAWENDNLPNARLARFPATELHEQR